jgi:NTP pyrophosphatase (non-canonical NTP hydrolase)
MTEDELRAHMQQHLAWAPNGEDRLRFLALALCGESGELANVCKKEWRDGGDKRDAIISELADVMIYTHLLAMHLRVDMRAAVVNKLLEVEQRPAWKGRHQ